MTASGQAEMDKLYKLANTFQSGMLVTKNPEGKLHGRPMRICKASVDEGFWMLTPSYAPKVRKDIIRTNYSLNTFSLEAWLRLLKKKY
jgi:general stress protein 26